MESNMEKIISAYQTLMCEKDFNVEECWKNIERVARTILKDRTKQGLSSWREAICSVFDLSNNGAFEILGEKFRPMIESIITDHVKGIKQKLAHENLLENYCAAWRDYKMDSNNLQMLFLHYNNWILKESNVNSQSFIRDSGLKKKFPNLEDMTNLAWKKHMLEPICIEITSLLWNAIEKEENEVTKVHEIVQSFEQVNADDLLETFFEKLGELYESKTSEWFQGLNAAEFIEKVVQMIEKEVTRCKIFLPERSIGKMKKIFIEKASCLERIDEMMMECQQMLKENRKDELENLYKILQLLPAKSNRFVRLSAILRITALNEAFNSSFLNMEEFEANLLSIYRKYNALIDELFSHNSFCIGELEKVLEYNEREDRCDGTRMLVKCMKELCSSENSVAESDLKASDLKLIFKKLNLPENLEMDDPNLKAVYWNKIRPIQPYRDAIRKFQADVMNGREFAPPGPGLLPFQVLISTNRGKFCIGSLIKEDKVLTAAQCCSGGRSFRFVLGANNDDDKPRWQFVHSTTAFIHEKYHPSSLEHDICIIHLDAAVRGEGIATIRLPSLNQNQQSGFACCKATVSGWERTSNGETSVITTQLVQREVTISEDRLCRSAYQIDTCTTFCAKGSSGICDGDTGGPLTITECDGIKTQIGIASFGPRPVDGGCKSHRPDGFVRLTAYLDWIQRVAGVLTRP